jgi:trk system potassium uptake protein TrkH
MCLSLPWSIYDLTVADVATEKDALIALAASVALAWGVGGVLFFQGRRGPAVIRLRESLLLVALSWVVGAALAALPYWGWSRLSGNTSFGGPDDPILINCYFEAMSGLTTTGATIFTDIAPLPRSLLFWRSFTHWLGGLGIVVLFVAVLPTLGAGGRQLFRIESPGPTPEGVRPRIQHAAQLLWMIYVGLSAVVVVLLVLGPMTFFEALCHTFGTLATGGFSTLNSSVAGFRSLYLEVVIIVFMVLAGVNFGIYYQILQGRWRSAVRNPEMRIYFIIIATATVLVGANLYGKQIETTAGEPVIGSFGAALRYALFQVVALTTTTGYCTADFDQWPFFSKGVLMILMFVGGSAGSTGGGVKVIRLIILVKTMLVELERVYRPHVVRTVRIGKSVVEHEMRLQTLTYCVGIVLLFAIGTTVLMILESPQNLDITSAATATAATLNNIGPGLDKVGATQNYAFFSPASKVVLCVLMLLGRLEVYTVIVLFLPRYWRQT